jgi:hypothetical protein
MNAYFHIIGCIASAQPNAAAIDECLDWVRRQDAEILAQNDLEAVFVKFDATDAELILYGCRAAAFRRPPILRFGFASGVKESAAGSGGTPRMGERGIAQACDLAGAAQPGQVLVSSQLGSLLQVAQVDPADRLRPMHVKLLNGRMASAYTIEAPRRASADDASRT